MLKDELERVWLRRVARVCVFEAGLRGTGQPPGGDRGGNTPPPRRVLKLQWPADLHDPRVPKNVDVPYKQLSRTQNRIAASKYVTRFQKASFLSASSVWILDVEGRALLLYCSSLSVWVL